MGSWKVRQSELGVVIGFALLGIVIFFGFSHTALGIYLLGHKYIYHCRYSAAIIAVPLTRPLRGYVLYFVNGSQ